MNAVAVGLFVLGETVWWVYSAIGVDPLPSGADVAFLAASVALGITALLLVRGAAERDGSAWIDAGVLALIAALGMWVTVIQPGAETDATVLERAFMLAYPVSDLLTPALILRMMLRRARTPATVAFTGGVVCLLAADTAFSAEQVGAFIAARRPIDAPEA